jgi:hypothetical protein
MTLMPGMEKLPQSGCVKTVRIGECVGFFAFRFAGFISDYG